MPIRNGYVIYQRMPYQNLILQPKVASKSGLVNFQAASLNTCVTIENSYSEEDFPQKSNDLQVTKGQKLNEEKTDSTIFFQLISSGRFTYQWLYQLNQDDLKRTIRSRNPYHDQICYSLLCDSKNDTE